jgi:hypothetical protein
LEKKNAIFPGIGKSRAEKFQGVETGARIFPRLGKNSSKISKPWKSYKDDGEKHEDYRRGFVRIGAGAIGDGGGQA